MGSPVTLRILFGGPEDSRKFTLDSGLPASVNELHNVLKTYFILTEEFRLQFFDPDFNEFINLSSMNELKDKSTLRVIILPSETLITLFPVVQEMEDTQTVSPAISTQCSDNAAPATLDSNDTVAQFSSSSSQVPFSSHRTSWPDSFLIPAFSYDAEVELEMGNREFIANGTCLVTGYKLKSVILDYMAEEIIKYSAYPSNSQLEKAAIALILTHPCLTEQGSSSGHWGWKNSLKMKMANYRTKLVQLGCPEVLVNSQKNKKRGKGKPAANIKKPRRAEVNYIPCHPKGITKESLEEDRVSMLSDMTKKHNEAVIRQKMERTFSYRREEVVQEPTIVDFQRRWPGLFQVNEINAEFIRITTVPLQSTFFAQLDQYTDRLIKVFRSAKGVVQRKINNILAVLDECNNSIDLKREVVIKGLCQYLKEDYNAFIKECMDSEQAEKAKEEMVLGICVVHADGAQQPPKEMTIVIEGVEVLRKIPTVLCAITLLMGIIYALDLRYPSNLQHTFEVFQKLFLNLDGQRLSDRVQKLKLKMFE